MKCLFENKRSEELIFMIDMLKEDLFCLKKLNDYFDIVDKEEIEGVFELLELYMISTKFEWRFSESAR